MTVKTGVYKIEHTATGKCYIGSAINMPARFRCHRSALNNKKHHSSKLQNSWMKYGDSAFSFMPLVICGKENLLIYEQILIDAYESAAKGFNIKPIAGSSLGYKHTEETLQKMKNIQSNRSPDINRKISEAVSGFKQSETAKANMRAAWGKLSPKERYDKVAFAAKARTGLKRSPMDAATKKKIGDANRGRLHTEESKKKMLGRPSHMKGKAHSEETKNKISVSRKGKYLGRKPYERTQAIKDKISAALTGRKIPQHVTDKALAVRRLNRLNNQVIKPLKGE